MKVYEKEDNKETTQQTSQDYKKPDASKVNHSQLDMTIRFPRAATGYGIAGKQINIVIQNVIVGETSRYLEKSIIDWIN
ncbi:3089_t:CDS:2 [Entrophospora sp. SA101]|nr:3089_t:CDS:2 [Entrophospora sp. SA101]